MSDIYQASGPTEKRPKSSERRYFPRWVVENKVLYHRDTHSFYRESTTKDLSCDGVCLTCPEEISPAQKLTLVVYLTEDVAVQVKGTVRWSKPSDKHSWVGVRFENTPSKIQDMILEYAFECNRELLTKHWFEGWE